MKQLLLKRVLSVLLVFVMIFGMIPMTMTAFAAAPEKATNVRWDGYVAKWDAVDNADKYEFVLWCGSSGIIKTETTGTQYDVSDYMAPGQTYEFSVYTVKGSDKSSDATSDKMTVSGTFGTVSGITWNGYKLSWNPVSDAYCYNLKLFKDGTQISTESMLFNTEYDFTDIITSKGAGTYYAKVVADYKVFCNNMASGSSESITVSDEILTNYTVTWKSQDGSSTLETDNDVASGAAPSYDGTEPTKVDDAQYTYTFAGWATSANQETGTAEDALPTVSGDVTYYAAFSKNVNKYLITVSGENGSTSGAGEYDAGSSVTVKAIPNSGYHFVKWTEDGETVSTNAEYTFTANANRDLVAVFEQDAPTKYTITVTSGKASAGAGTQVDEAPAGTVITLTADAAPAGQVFDKWVVTGVTLDDDTSETATFTMPANNVTAEATYKPAPAETTSVIVNKVWAGELPEGESHPSSVTVYLMANGTKVEDSEVTLNANNNWTHTWTDLPEGDASAASVIVYTVGEEAVSGYESKIEANATVENGFTITNTYVPDEEPETVDIYGTKTWVGDTEADRPESIIVNLLANGEAFDEVEVKKDTQWTFYFGELPKYDEAGAEIEYSVQEEEVEGYTATYDGYNITNTLKEEEPEVPEKPVYGIVVKNGKSYTGAGVEVSAAEEGTKITLKADAAPEGKEFDKWVVNNGTITLADATKAETTFDMPAERVQVTATYKDKVVTPPADDDNDDNKDDVNKPSDDDKEDESKPSDTNKPATDTESPKTGDTSNIFMWFAVLFVSGFALVGFLLFGKRRRA